VVLQEMRLRDFIIHARRLYGGKVLSLAGASCYRGREITVTPLAGRLLLEADGEIPGEAPVRIRVLQGAIRILAPWHLVTTVI
jgi:diacylglycerol kinase family enzyme